MGGVLIGIECVVACQDAVHAKDLGARFFLAVEGAEVVGDGFVGDCRAGKVGSGPCEVAIHRNRSGCDGGWAIPEAVVSELVEDDVVGEVLAGIGEEGAAVVVAAVRIDLHIKVEVDEDFGIVGVDVLESPEKDGVGVEGVERLHCCAQVGEDGDGEDDHHDDVGRTEPTEGIFFVYFEDLFAVVVVVEGAGLANFVEMSEEDLAVEFVPEFVGKFVVPDGHVIPNDVVDAVDAEVSEDAIEAGFDFFIIGEFVSCQEEAVESWLDLNVADEKLDSVVAGKALDAEGEDGVDAVSFPSPWFAMKDKFQGECDAAKEEIQDEEYGADKMVVETLLLFHEGVVDVIRHVGELLHTAVRVGRLARRIMRTGKRFLSSRVSLAEKSSLSISVG